MPGSVIAETTIPGQILQFTEDDHRYVLKDKKTGKELRQLTSSTTLIDKYFPEFKSNEISLRSACRALGVDPNLPPSPIVEAKAAEIRAEWKGAADYGTRVHEYMEDLMRGRKPRNTPETEKERIVFELGAGFVKKVKPKLENIMPERIVCDPYYAVSGCIDLLAKDPHTDQLIIMDWKTNKSISTYSSEYAYPPISHFMNCKLSHYILQLNLYEFILKHAGYIPEHIKVLKYLVHLHQTKGVTVIPIADHFNDIVAILEDFKSKQEMA